MKVLNGAFEFQYTPIYSSDSTQLRRCMYFNKLDDLVIKKMIAVHVKIKY